MRIGRIFYFDKREEEIYHNLLENVKRLTEGSKYLEKAIMELRGEQHDKDVSKAIAFEKKCDIEVIQITEKILKIKNSRSRQNLLLLNQSIKKIAKAIEGAGYRVQMSQGIRLPDYLNSGLQEMATAMRKTVEALGRVFDKMPYFSEEIIKHLEEVHVYEEKMDKLRRQRCAEFIHSSEKIPVQKYYIWQGIVNKLELIADSCEEVGEIINRIIVSKE